MRPLKVFLFIVCVMVCLGALCIVLPGRIAWGEKTLRWPTLTEVFKSDTQTSDLPEFPEFTDTIASIDSVSSTALALASDTIARQEPVPVAPKVEVNERTDSRIFLEAFYSALSNTPDRIVRVLHYGDSQIEEDRMTQQIRDALQTQYGGAGVGLMPLVQTIPCLTVRQEIRMNGRTIRPAQGPRRYLVFGPKRDQRTDGLYGPMGQMAVMNDSLVKGSEIITAICTPQNKGTRYSQWKIFADTSIHYSIGGDTVQFSGRGSVYGLSQQSEHGVIVDNIPMRGCLGLVFTKMDRTQLSTFYRDENVRLIIMQFGGNAIPSNRNPGTISAIVAGLREQVQYIRTCAPEAAILFIGPSDMLTQIDGEWQTYPMVPYMDKLLRKMALEENIAYYSLYQWMGGSGSMAKWQEIGLAGSDGVHFTRAGARKAGKAVAQWILEGMSNENKDTDEIVE